VRVQSPVIDDPEPVVVAALKAGTEADFDDWLGEAPPTTTSAGWGANRTLSAQFIAKLCMDSSGPTNPYPRGIRIKGARIGEPVDLSTATIGGLLLLERCRIESNISLRDSTTKLVNFAGSRVCGSINADRLRCSGGVYLRDGFSCDKFVRLSAATINGDLDCRKGTIEGAIEDPATPGPKLALRCDRAAITGSVFFVSFVAKGEVRLLDASVGANLVCKDAAFANTNGHALVADNARIAGSLILREWKPRPTSPVSLRNATARVLNLGAPEDAALGRQVIQAQGFRYDTIGGERSVNLGLAMRWLDAIVTQPFNPQPYEQCAKVLRENGLADQAKEVGILRRQVERSLSTKTHQKVSGWMLEKLIGYGYRPGRSAWMLLALTVVGTVVFLMADASKAMLPTDATAAANYVAGRPLPDGYPQFNALVYSADVVLPIIDFQQDSKWRPTQTTTATIGTVAVWTMRFLIAAGWILSTLLVASVSGLIRKD
jgi:uncharacterized membrane protein